MSVLALALSFFLQAQPAAEPPAEPAPAPAAEAPAAEAPAEPDFWPKGLAHDDYQLVAWCYGALRGYVDLHDQVMPEVTRIETTFRPPGRKLSDDMKVYGDMQKAATKQLKQFQAALTAAEKASLRPINTVGAAAVGKGRSVWEGADKVTPARLAQEWMGWALPAKCETTAKTLEERATLMGASFKVNAEADPPAEDKPAADAPAPSDPGKLLTEGPPADAPKPDEPATEPKPN